MFQDNELESPWGRSLKLTTTICLVVFGGVILAGLIVKPGNESQWQIGMIGIPTALATLPLLFIIRGYRIEDNTLAIKRLIWDTRIDLSDIQSVEIDPLAMNGSVRLFGNGGLYCFAGLFRNKRLGTSRVFANDPKRSVVLQSTRRTIVITPDSPEDFVATIDSAHSR